MDPAVTPGTTRRAAAGASPPAKRWAPTVTNEQERQPADTLEDYATRIDQHHQALKILGSGLKNAEEKDQELREKLLLLEAQVTTNEERLKSAEKDVVSNDQELENKLQVLEQQLHATAAAASQPAAGPALGELVSMPPGSTLLRPRYANRCQIRRVRRR